MDTSTNFYDEVLYPGYAFPQTHPNRLATIATLCGMQPAPVENCRVLELGCSDGNNLLPLALLYPESRFVGIDLAGRPVEMGRALARELGLQNIELRQFDVMKVSPDFGEFDYIIAHGLFSWVPAVVREKVLAVCRANLAPQGVAFISYNAYPGGYARQMLRDMMLFHVRNIREPQQRINQARAFLKFLLDAQQQNDDPYRILLEKEAERVITHPDGHFFHDDLEEVNAMFYFYQFVEQAARHDLQYLAEADFFEMQDYSFPPHVVEKLRGLSDNLVLKEQYADFIKCRRFRQTLLCHGEVEIRREARPEMLRRFHVASPARPASAEPDIKSNAVERFDGIKGAAVSTDNPLAKAALVHLGELWPLTLAFDDLLHAAHRRLGVEATSSTVETPTSSPETDARLLSNILWQLYAANLVELHLAPSHFVLQPGERPLASPLARLQLQRSPVVTSLRHTSVNVADEFGRRLLQMLDGTRDRAALLRELRALVEAGVPLLEDGDQPAVSDAPPASDALAEHLERNLSSLARHALLLA
ncbi:MAG TPA: class I SAM-dependent methyltransferase [Pyrinomonadaceae bacterium]|jgi:SAM-dependent methyltransferase